METSLKDIKIFLFSYIISSFFELFFNREFLVGVLPLGMAGINLSKSIIFIAFYYIGAIAYGLVFALQFILIGISAYVGKLSKETKGLLWAVLYLTILFDLIHLAEGVNNTAFNPPVLSSFIYVLIIITAIFFIIRDLNKKILYVLIIPDLLAFGVLIGSWLIELSKLSIFGEITYFCGTFMAYSIIIVGSIFVVYSIIVKKVNLKYYIPAAMLGLPVFIVALFNLVPGIAMAMGFTFPYILGILGVRNWMPPIFFLIAIFALFSSIGLYKNDKKLSLAVLGLLSGALIFDTVSSTTYLLMPLVAIILGSLI
jgi:hypothetical protein